MQNHSTNVFNYLFTLLLALVLFDHKLLPSFLVLPPGVITRTLEIWNIRFAQLQQTVTVSL